MKIKLESNNVFPIDNDVNIYTATIIIRAIFAIKMVNTILNYF